MCRVDVRPADDLEDACPGRRRVDPGESGQRDPVAWVDFQFRGREDDRVVVDVLLCVRLVTVVPA